MIVPRMIAATDPEWPDTKAWLEEQIDLQRSQLEAWNAATEAEHNITRGRIAAYRHVIQTVEAAGANP